MNTDTRVKGLNTEFLRTLTRFDLKIFLFQSKMLLSR